MHRLGFRHENLRWTLPELLGEPESRARGASTRTLRPPTSPSIRCSSSSAPTFETACATLQALGARPRYRHAANSAALLRDSRVWYDFVRPGLLLHGVVPPPLATTMALQPVMSLTSRVVAVKGIRAGETVGYGARFTPDRPTTLAVIPAGYADGLDRRLEDRGSVLIRGQRARHRRRREHGHADRRCHRHRRGESRRRSRVSRLAGRRARCRRSTPARWPHAVSTIPYEVLCRLGARVHRAVPADATERLRDTEKDSTRKTSMGRYQQSSRDVRLRLPDQRLAPRGVARLLSSSPASFFDEQTLCLCASVASYLSR